MCWNSAECLDLAGLSVHFRFGFRVVGICGSGCLARERGVNVTIEGI